VRERDVVGDGEEDVRARVGILVQAGAAPEKEER
jgi:hypothetical protein